MKYIFPTVLLLVACALPQVVLAHASPLEYAPPSGAQLTEAPQEIRIRFSERVETGASRIVVKDDAGKEYHVGEAQVDAADAHLLSVPVVRHGGGSTHIVSWSVVSADDGHFTKGSYAYAIGSSTGAMLSVPQFEIVQTSALPEATAIFIELFGNSLLWGLLTFLFLLRPLKGAMTDAQRTLTGRMFQGVAVLGVGCILAGGGTHFVFKTAELAALHGLSFADALPLYLATASGFATAIRSVVALAFAALFALGRKTLHESMRVTAVDIALFICLLGFAYLSGKISHATANPFYPHLSVLVNTFHLISKDLWVGIGAMLTLIHVSPTMRTLMPQLIHGAFRILAVAFGVVGATASYIIWLHLKDPANITTTLWGERFMPLIVAAVLAVAFLAYHIIAYRLYPAFVGRFLAYTHPAAWAIGTSVIFCSAFVIITSPPLEKPQAASFEAESNGLTIRLERAPFEDGKALLSIEPGEGLSTPVVLIGGEGGLLVELERRFEGGFVFPLILLSVEPEQVTVSVSQPRGYDGTASFRASRKELDPSPPVGHGRSLDGFTLMMALVGLASACGAAVLYLCARSPYQGPDDRNSIGRFSSGFIGGIVLLVLSIGMVRSYAMNAFKAECAADGNGWHIMLPTRNGTPVSGTPQEGCMAHGGMFHFADPREYRFFKTSGTARMDMPAHPMHSPSSF